MIAIGHGSFDPAKVKIEKGASRDLPQRPGDARRSYRRGDDGSWKSPPLALDGKFTKRFGRAGPVGFHIEQHPQVKGEIVVE